MADSHLPHHIPPGSSRRLGGTGHEGEHDFSHESHSRSDTSPVPPSSPGLSTAFHRHGPGHAEDPMSFHPALRRRITGRNDNDILRIAIATPFSEHERRKERSVAVGTTVAVFKDMIAHDEEQKWERNGMRLVWQGRIVRDEETLGDIVGKREPGQVHTFHLVARRLEGQSNTTRLAAPEVSTEQPSSVFTTSSAQPASLNVRALADSVHFILFLVRHHLCHLLGSPALAWNDTMPPPVVDQNVAKQAVMSVIAAFAATRQDREEGWERWEAGFQDVEEINWTQETRSELEKEIKSLWSSRLGRHWQESDDGEKVQVELDGIPYQLNLPPLRMMAPRQLIHLAIYLRLTSLLPLLNDVLSTAVAATTISPTPTTIVASSPVRVRQYGIRIRLNRVVLSAMFFGALKVGAMMWMLTRGLKWSDVKFWIIGGGLVGWYIAEVLAAMRPGVVWGRDINGQNAEPRQDGQVAPAGAHQPTDQHAASGAVAQPGVANADRIGQPPRFVASSGNALYNMIPLVHLNIDSEELHLAPRPSQSRVSPFVIRVFMPIILWIITLIPEWEMIRARTIRRRERAMRVWVGELTASQANEVSSDQTRGDGTQESAMSVPTEQQAERPPVLPEGLSAEAKQYYERVIARGEGIDWEEEREAQRAMGIGED